MSVKKHYDTHLGNFYEWMVGDFEDNQTRQQTLLSSWGIQATGTQYALDLGAGHGLHSISLSNLGFQVTSIDFNEQLLQSLRKRSEGHSIEVIDSDILSYLEQADSADLVVCMGDTLAHLPSFKDVEKMIARVHDILAPEGLFILSFRDYQTELRGTQRFIPVKSDDLRILTCFLEYEDETVLVTDLLHEFENGSWQQKASSYKKLRLGVQKVQDLMQNKGFRLTSADEIRRMHYLIFQK